MAIGSLLDFLVKRGEVRNVRGANAAFDRLHETVKDDEKYSPDRFRQALKDMGDSLGLQPR